MAPPQTLAEKLSLLMRRKPGSAPAQLDVERGGAGSAGAAKAASRQNSSQSHGYRTWSHGNRKQTDQHTWDAQDWQAQGWQTQRHRQADRDAGQVWQDWGGWAAGDKDATYLPSQSKKRQNKQKQKGKQRGGARPPSNGQQASAKDQQRRSPDPPPRGKLATLERKVEGLIQTVDVLVRDDTDHRKERDLVLLIDADHAISYPLKLALYSARNIWRNELHRTEQGEDHSMGAPNLFLWYHFTRRHAHKLD